MNPTLALRYYFLSFFPPSFSWLRGAASIPKKETASVQQEGCFSYQAESSNEWKGDGEQGGGALGLEDVTNFL
jgi:hypothetical protein